MVTIRENNQTGLRGIMKKLFALPFLVLLTAGPALCQTQQNEPDSRTASPHHLSYGLIGLTGLLGLLGLRRPKSIEHQRMAAADVNVSTVPIHLPESYKARSLSLMAVRSEATKESGCAQG
jgi:hypothetical protein